MHHCNAPTHEGMSSEQHKNNVKLTPFSSLKIKKGQTRDYRACPFKSFPSRPNAGAVRSLVVIALVRPAGIGCRYSHGHIPGIVAKPWENNTLPNIGNAVIDN